MQVYKLNELGSLGLDYCYCIKNVAHSKMVKMDTKMIFSILFYRDLSLPPDTLGKTVMNR